jgi:branched-chain amino acid transport system substrate-binding protein
MLAGGVAGLAGCTSSENQNGGGGGGGNDSNGSSSGPTGGGGDLTLRVGGLFPTSGPYSAIGTDQRVGMEVAISHMEEEGIGVSFETVVKDTQLAPNTGLRRAREMVQNSDVDVLTGTGSTSVASAVSNYAQQNQIPFMITTSTGQSLTGSNCNQYTFRSNTHTYQNQKPNAEYMMENLGKRFATMGADYSWGRASVEDFVNVAKQHGGEVVRQVWPKLGATDYSTEIQKVANTNADFLLVRCSGTDAINSAQQIASFGLKEQMDIVTNQTSIMAKGAGDACIGFYGGIPYHAILTKKQTGNDENERFVKDYREMGNGSYPATYAATSYMGLRFLGKAAVKAGSTDADALKSALEGVTYDGPKGPMTIRPCDHQATNALWSTRLVSPEGTEFNFPIPKIFKKHEQGTNLLPCEENPCNL